MGVRIIAIYLIFMGIFAIVNGMFPLQEDLNKMTETSQSIYDMYPVLLIILGLITGIFCFITSYGLFTKKRFGYKLSSLFGFFSLFSILPLILNQDMTPLLTLVAGILILLYLRHQSTKDYFRMI